MLEALWKKILRRSNTSLLAIPALLLWLVSLVYRLGFALWKAFTKPTVKLNIPVISVGNISIGGTGKTPLVESIARYLINDGCRVAIVSSGYGRPSHRSFMEPGYKVQNMGTDETGDEVKFLARSLPEAWFSVDDIKAVAAQAAADSGHVDVVIVDDGFQHLRLARDIDIVTYDAGIERKILQLFPYGVLREPMSALKRADIIVITRSKFAKDIFRLQARLKRINKSAQHYHAKFGATILVGREQSLPIKYLKDKSVFLFAGVGNFWGLERQVSALCADLDYALELSDHQEYTPELLARIKAMADKYDSDLILTTGKDWTKIESFDFDREFYYLDQTVDLDPGEEKLIAYLVDKLKLPKRVD